MLIHATRLKKLQNRLTDLVSDFIDEIHAAFSVSQLDKTNQHLQNIESTFIRQFSHVQENWNEISSHLSEAISSLKNHIYSINGDNKDVIDEEKFPNGLNSIRIGGDKLSRGLTLPGLVTSYFLRVSNYTLCRWEDGLDIETIIQIYVRYIPLLGYIIGLAMSQCLRKSARQDL